MNEPIARDVLEVHGDQEVLDEGIRFHGTVHVKGSVLDDFTIKCTGKVIVEGNVYAARIVSLQSVAIRGGFNGKIRGTILAGEDVGARCVADAVIHAGRDVLVEEAIEASEVKCLGKIHAGGAIRGGVLVARGDIRAAEIGAPDGTKTFVVSGRNYLMDSHEDLMRIIADRFSQDILQVRAQLDGVLGEAKNLEDLEPAKQIRAKVLMQKLEASGISLENAKKKIDPEAVPRQECPNEGITVLRRLYAGTEVTVGNTTHTFDKNLAGPIRIDEDDKRQTVAIHKLIPTSLQQ